MADREPTWDERILARVNTSVDPTLIAESLRLTPTERILRLEGMLAFVESVHQGSRPPVFGSAFESISARDVVAAAIRRQMTLAALGFLLIGQLFSKSTDSEPRRPRSNPSYAPSINT